MRKQIILTNKELVWIVSQLDKYMHEKDVRDVVRYLLQKAILKIQGDK